MRSTAALLLPTSLLLSIAVIAVLRDRGVASRSPLCGSDLAFIAAYVAWGLAELRVSRRDAWAGGSSSDRYTRELYGLSQGLVMLSALWFGASHPAVSVVVVAGAVLFVVGFSLRLWAVFTLGRYYSHEVRILADHAVVNSGPYRLLRHPAYTGMIMAHLGVLVMFFNSVTLALFCCAFLPLIVLRIFVEERVLMSVNGYAAFSAGRKRLVPFVW